MEGQVRVRISRGTILLFNQDKRRLKSIGQTIVREHVMTNALRNTRPMRARPGAKFGWDPHSINAAFKSASCRPTVCRPFHSVPSFKHFVCPLSRGASRVTKEDTLSLRCFTVTSKIRFLPDVCFLFSGPPATRAKIYSTGINIIILRSMYQT